MEETVYDPLERYKSVYRDEFRKNAQSAFDELAAKAKIDKEANKLLCEQIAQSSETRNGLSASLSRYSVVRVACWILAIALFLAWALCEHPMAPLALLPFPIAVCANLFLFNKKIRTLREKIGNLDEEIRRKKDEAWKQMEPLNALFDWDIPARLFEKTVPKIHFDGFFTESRIGELVHDFGYDGSLNENASVLFSQSGEINGNPFVVADMKTFEMGEKTYTGYKTIHWTETVTGFDGKRHRVVRSQTLSASIARPCPFYGKRSFVLYGNDAAPNLTFTREPSNLVEDGFLQDFRRKRKLRKLEKFSRNLKDESQYTLMGNREFETLFETMDRNDEVEYRLLFTALAQKQMLSLIREKTDAYGDDFSFFKSRKINVVVPGHLNDFDMDTNPERFARYSYEESRNNFLRINREYFRAVYFSLAPLLCIPLYQQIRPQKEIYKGKSPRSSFWEWESIANFYGMEAFRHPGCVTDCILKTREETGKGESRRIAVTAHGFSGTDRIEYVPVFGGDGRTHGVPVPWVEYEPVSKTSSIVIEDSGNFPKSRTAHGLQAGEIYRRGIFSSRPQKGRM